MYTCTEGRQWKDKEGQSLIGQGERPEQILTSWPSEEINSVQHFDLELQASRMVRKYISVVWLICGTLGWQPKQTKYRHHSQE